MEKTKTNKFIETVSKKINPKLTLKKKNETWWMRVLVWFFTTTRINPAFASYYTTIRNTIHVPDYYDDLNDGDVLPVIMHETLHLKDAKRWPILFQLSYLFPQILSVFALLSFLNPWFLLFLLFLLPIPAPFRYVWELRAFRISVIFDKVFNNENQELKKNTKEFIAVNLSERYYYWAMPLKAKILKDLDDETFMSDPYYKEFIDFCRESAE